MLPLTVALLVRVGHGQDASGSEEESSQYERELYIVHKRGLHFGLPKGAYADAVRHMRALESAAVKFPRAHSFNGMAAAHWSSIGPRPLNDCLPNFGGAFPGTPYKCEGRVSAIVTDPTNVERVFVGTAGGGVWMTTDGGASFVPITNALPTQATGALALDPINTNPPTIYVATGEGNGSADSYYGQGIFVSTNLGQSWTSLAPGTFDHVGFTKLAIDATQNPPRLFAAVTFGLSASRADGPLNESSSGKTGLWRSIDGGATWTLYPSSIFGCHLKSSVDACPAMDVVIDPANPTQVYVGIEFAGVFRSSDGGASWSLVTLPGIASGLNHMGRESLAVGPPTSGAPRNCSGGTKVCGTVYAMIGAFQSGEYVGFFSSIDGGRTWRAENVPSWQNGTSKRTIDGTSPENFSQSFYDQTLLVSPMTPATVFFGGVGIYESTDAGAHWTFLAQNGGTHSDQHALAVASGNNTVYVGNDGGAYAFQIGAVRGGVTTFTSLNDTLSSGQIQGIGPHPMDPTLLLAGFQDNGTGLFSGALDWSEVQTGDGGFTLFDRTDASVAYHTFTRWSIANSTDGGTTWMDASKNLFLTVRRTAAVAAANMGATTMSLKSPAATGFPETGAIWAIGSTGLDVPYVLGSDNRTLTLAGSLPVNVIDGTLISVAEPVNFYPPIASDPSVGHRVLFGTNHIYVSTDGMASWQQQETTDLTGDCPNGVCAPGCSGGACALQDLELAPSDHTRAYALSMQSGSTPFKVFNTSQADADRGAIWNNVTPHLEAAFPIGKTAANTQATGIAVGPHDSNLAFIALSGFTSATGIGHVYRTQDFGTTWTRADGAGGEAALPDVPTLKILVDKADASGKTVLAGTDIGVFRSIDGGITWAAFNLGTIPPVAVFDLAQNDGGVIFAGTHGRGAFSDRLCVGDCVSEGQVTVNDLLEVVNIALGNTPVSSCPLGDADGDGEITIDEVIAAVTSALNRCGTN